MEQVEEQAPPQPEQALVQLLEQAPPQPEQPSQLPEQPLVQPVVHVVVQVPVQEEEQSVAALFTIFLDANASTLVSRINISLSVISLSSYEEGIPEELIALNGILFLVKCSDFIICSEVGVSI